MSASEPARFWDIFLAKDCQVLAGSRFFFFLRLSSVFLAWTDQACCRSVIIGIFCDVFRFLQIFCCVECAITAGDDTLHMYSRHPKNLARQLLSNSYKSAMTGSQRPICKRGARVGVRGFRETGCKDLVRLALPSSLSTNQRLLSNAPAQSMRAEFRNQQYRLEQMEPGGRPIAIVVSDPFNSVLSPHCGTRRHHDELVVRAMVPCVAE